MNRDAMWYLSRGVLVLAIIFTLALKIPLLGIGAPYVTIDDGTAYNGGFLVWFGNAPPQRMYLESWINGASSLATYVWKMVSSGQASSLGTNLVADAYRDFYNNPEAYVRNYRGLMLAVDILTAFLVFILGRCFSRGRSMHWLPYVATSFYLLSFNTIWCNVVARPDTLTAFFGVLGLLGYYYSDFGSRKGPFFLGAIAFGLCAGMKLHGAFFVVFILLDMIRQHGFRRGLNAALPFALVAGFMFLVAAGSPLFDPLKYVKLRMLNVADDESPWIHWGDQVVTALRGTGWLVLPLVVWTSVLAWRERKNSGDPILLSLGLLSLCWLLLFLSIRQLRAYWMLPVLPLFYLAALRGIAQWRDQRVIAGVLSVMLVILGWQSVQQARELTGVQNGALKNWVLDNIPQDEPFFIFGFSALDVPKNTQCFSRVRQGLERGFTADLEAGLPHVERHLKNWEEQSSLALMDMLGFQNQQGYEFYSYFGAPLDRFAGIIDINNMMYILVQEGFENPADFPLQEFLVENFDLVVAEIFGNGGGGRGLRYKIYRRRVEGGA